MPLEKEEKHKVDDAVTVDKKHINGKCVCTSKPPAFLRDMDYFDKS